MVAVEVAAQDTPPMAKSIASEAEARQGVALAALAATWPAPVEVNRGAGPGDAYVPGCGGGGGGSVGGSGTPGGAGYSGIVIFSIKQ